MTQRSTVACLRALLPVTVAAMLLGIGAHLVRADGPVHVVAAGLGTAYLLWILVESRITTRHPRESAAENDTLLPYALCRAGVGVSAVLWPLPWNGLSVWLSVPAAVFLGAVALRLTAIRVLGRFYSHHVVRYSDHTVVTTGPYRWVRHPAYTGMLLANAGFVGFFANPLSAVLLLVLCALVVWRVLVEERVLFTVPGYSTYAAGRARLLPRVW